MEQKGKKNYEAPQLTTVTFKTERGYASSNLTATLGLWEDVYSPSNTDGLVDYNVQTEDNWF